MKEQRQTYVSQLIFLETNDRNCKVKCLFQINVAMKLLMYFENNEKQNKL